MNPLVLAVPIAGALALYLLWPRQAAAATADLYRPPPPGSGSVTMSGGVRALQYINQIDMALVGYRTAKVIGGAGLASALANLKGVLDVVGGMAAQDLAQRQITPQDLATIQAKVEAAKKEIV